MVEFSGFVTLIGLKYNAKKRVYNFDRHAEVMSRMAQVNRENYARYRNNMLCEVSRLTTLENEEIPNQLCAASLASRGFHHGTCK